MKVPVPRGCQPQKNKNSIIVFHRGAVHMAQVGAHSTTHFHGKCLSVSVKVTSEVPPKAIQKLNLWAMTSFPNSGADSEGRYLIQKEGLAHTNHSSHSVLEHLSTG